MKIIREACVENFIEAKKMMDLGAERIELCENLAVGGTTPSYGTIMHCITYLSIPTLVMIRPRGGDFIYSKDEIGIMKEDIKLCREIGVKGVVLGVLTKEQNKISIVVAGKVTKDNLEYISKIIPNREYHGKKIIV